MNENRQQQVHPAQAAQEFMKRADMKGGEVEVFAQTFNWLGQVQSGDIVCIPQDDHQTMLDDLASLRKDVATYKETYGSLPETE